MNIEIKVHQDNCPRPGTVVILLPNCHCNPSNNSIVSLAKQSISYLSSHKLPHEAVLWPHKCFPGDEGSDIYVLIAQQPQTWIYSRETCGDLHIKNHNGHCFTQNANPPYMQHIFMDSPLGDFIVLSEKNCTDENKRKSIIAAIWAQKNTFKPDFVFVCAASHSLATRRTLRKKLKGIRTDICGKSLDKPHIVIRDYYSPKGKDKYRNHIYYEADSSLIPVSYAQQAGGFTKLTFHLDGKKYKTPPHSKNNALLTEQKK